MSVKQPMSYILAFKNKILNAHHFTIFKFKENVNLYNDIRENKSINFEIRNLILCHMDGF